MNGSRRVAVTQREVGDCGSPNPHFPQTCVTFADRKRIILAL